MVKWSNPGKGVAPFPTPRCSSYWKGSLRVALDYGRQLIQERKDNSVYHIICLHSVWKSNNSIWPLDSITIWPLDSITIRMFNVIPGHSLGESYSSVGMQSAYSTAPANWAEELYDHLTMYKQITDIYLNC